MCFLYTFICALFNYVYFLYKVPCSDANVLQNGNIVDALSSSHIYMCSLARSSRADLA